MLGFKEKIRIKPKKRRSKILLRLLFFNILFSLFFNAGVPVHAASVFRESRVQPLDRIDRTVAYEAAPSHHFYNNPLIRIRQVVFCWEQQNILIGLDGVHGELYILRLSQEETGIVMEELMYAQDFDIQLNINAALHEGLHYTIALYDYYNTRHAVFTWRQPFYFEAYTAVVTQEFIDVPPKPLVKTNDLFNNPILYAALLCVIIFLIIARLSKRERSFA